MYKIIYYQSLLISTHSVTNFPHTDYATSYCGE